MCNEKNMFSVFDRLKAEDKARKYIAERRKEGICDTELIEKHLWKCCRYDESLIDDIMVVAHLAYEYNHKLYLKSIK